MILLHIFYRQQGEYAHCKVFMGPDIKHMAHAGNLVMFMSDLVALSRGQFNAEFFMDQYSEEEDRNA